MMALCMYSDERLKVHQRGGRKRLGGVSQT